MTGFSDQQISAAQKALADVLCCPISCKTQITKGEELSVIWDGLAAEITAPDTSALCRAFFLINQAFEEGKTKLCIHEKRHIASCGAFLDCSRGAVITVEACKRYLDHLAALGLNLLVLYMEDTYTVPEYPYFGHLRGRYTPEELREIDDYAASLDIEVLPQIQTLAHMEHFLQWRDDEHLQDTPFCLLADEEETYALIEDEIRSIRNCFRTNRIHIGMDEAHNMGLMRYYAKHGPVDRFELLERHLKRVTDICAKYHFHPMMWSDMFFRLGSKTNDYYDIESHIPQSVIEHLPDVDMVYWDYYHTEPEMYEHMLTEHERMGNETVFAGGIWTWSGFLPQVERNDATMYPALKACAAHHIKTVFATMWGDDGNETNCFLALSQLPIFSEFCWRGPDCSRDEVTRMAESLTGLQKETYAGFGHFYKDATDDRTGKGLVYCDLLYRLLPGNPDLKALILRYEEGREMIKANADRFECIYAGALFDLVIQKAKIILKIRDAYQRKDRNQILEVGKKDIPALIRFYEKLYINHRIQWMNTYKPNGWEIFPLRYGSVIGRMKDVALTLVEYGAGDRKCICELEEPALDPARMSGESYKAYVTPRKL